MSDSANFLFGLLFFGVVDLHLVGDLEFHSELASWVVGEEDLHLDTHDSLLEEDVSVRVIDEVELGLTGRDEVT